MPTYLIERHIPGVETMGEAQLQSVVRKSNDVLEDLGFQVRWSLSYVVEGKTICLLEAPDEDMIREHARLSGFPCNRITAVKGILDPATGAIRS